MASKPAPSSTMQGSSLSNLTFSPTLLMRGESKFRTWAHTWGLHGRCLSFCMNTARMGSQSTFFFPTGITTFQQFANPVYTKILWWCLLLISRICKRGWNTCQQKRKHRSIYQGRTWAEQQSQYKCQSDFHTKWAMSSRLEVRLSWERCSSPTDTHGEQGLWHSQRLG